MPDLLDPRLLDDRAEAIALEIAEATEQPIKDEYFPPEAVEFLRAAGFEVDRDLLDRLARLNRTPGPANSRYTAAQVGHLVAYLSRLRLWQPGYHRYEHLRSRFEAEASARKAAGLPAVDGLDAFPVRFLVIMLAEEPHPVARQAIQVVLLEKLETLGVDPHA